MMLLSDGSPEDPPWLFRGVEGTLIFLQNLPVRDWDPMVEHWEYFHDGSDCFYIFPEEERLVIEYETDTGFTTIECNSASFPYEAIFVHMSDDRDDNADVLSFWSAKHEISELKPHGLEVVCCPGCQFTHDLVAPRETYGV